MPVRAAEAYRRGMELEDAFPATLTDIPEEARPPANLEPVWLVDGRVEPWDGPTSPVTSPVALGGRQPIVLGHEARLGAEQAHRAVAAAERAWAGGAGDWPAAPASERIAAVERFATALESRADDVARLLMFEIGKPWSSARGEVTRSIDYMRESAAIAADMDAAGRKAFTGMKGSTTHYARERRLPIGIVLCVAPFNYPVNELLTTVAPALLMGNVVIAKTPRFGALATLAIAGALAEAFPPGVVSLLPGDGRQVIPPVMRATRVDQHERQGTIDMLAFIGSEPAANAILGAHPTPVSLHKVLGLGSKNAAVILPGADLDAAAAAIVKGALGFNGQRCTAEKMIFCPRADAERVAEMLAERVAALRVGMPWDDGVTITPLPEPDKPERMATYIEDAVARGARVLNPGGGDSAGALVRPAVLYPVDDSMRIAREEQFGPIVPVAAYDDVEEVYRWQRSSAFGQQVGIWGPDADVRPVVRTFSAEVARVNINDVCQRGPDSFGFTATDKSGFGILSLTEALDTFSRPVLIQSTSEASLDSAAP